MEKWALEGRREPADFKESLAKHVSKNLLAKKQSATTEKSKIT